MKTASGATAVQIVYSSRRGARDIEHIGSAHDDAELAVLKAAASSGWPLGRANSTWGWSAPRRPRRRVGLAHDDAELEVLKAAARYRLTAGQAELDLGLDFAAAMPAGGRGGPLPITRRGWGIWWMS